MLKKYLDSFIALFFPTVCITCKDSIPGTEGIICTRCMHSLPETNFHVSDMNPISDIFSGRLRLSSAMALLFFDKGSKYRKLVYALKYKERKDVGLFLGKLMGSRLTESHQKFDYLIPIPLHKKKLRKRGFNQSAVLAEGVSAITHIPVLENALTRKIYNPTQTRKGRYDRWINVEGIFSCKDTSMLEDKHVLLIDDVITTGSTLEAAGSCLLQIKGTTISIASAAYTIL